MTKFSKKNIKKIIKKILPQERGEIWGMTCHTWSCVPEGELWIFTKDKFYKYTYEQT